MIKSGLNRRRFLRSAGICLSLPFMPSLFGDQKHTAKAKRFVAVAPQLGMWPEGFHPKESGSNYIFPECLKELEYMRKDFTVFSNINLGAQGGHKGVNLFLRAGYAKTKDLWSVDQRMAEHYLGKTRFASLNLWHHDRGVSFTRVGACRRSIASPVSAFREMFVEDSPEAKARMKNLHANSSSILDLVNKDAQSLKSKLNSEDKDKFEEYFNSIRETEKKIEATEKWIDVKKATSAPPKALEAALDYEPRLQASLNYETRNALWYDLAILALTSGSTNVVTMTPDWGITKLKGVDMDYHTISHHGKNQTRLAQLKIVEKVLLRQWGKFVDKLKKVKDSSGAPLLDSTIALFGSGMGSGSTHKNTNLPILLAGGGFKHGTHHNKGARLSDLYLTMLHQMGIKDNHFNGSSGTLTELL